MITIPTTNEWTDEQVAHIKALFTEIGQDHPLGLVRMKFTDSPAPYMKDQIAGLDPAQAAQMFRYEMAFPCTETGEPISFSGIRKSEQAPAASSNAVPIPDNWEGMHHLQQIRLAKEIIGEERSMGVVEAKDIIAAELQRRGET